MAEAQNVALVTGAARGIGRAIAERLAADGYAVVVADMADGSEAVHAVTDAGHKAVAVSMDVTDEASIARALDEARKALGPISVLVNNAGVHANPPVPLPDLPVAEWRRIMSINLDGMFLVARAVLPDMIERKWGRIINIASSSANALTPPGMAHYIASKAGVIGFTRGLATDVGEYGIAVNAIAPTGVITPGLLEIGTSDKFLDILTQQQAIKRVVQATDVAGLVSFFASEDSAMISAQTVFLDGGGIRAG